MSKRNRSGRALRRIEARRAAGFLNHDQRAHGATDMPKAHASDNTTPATFVVRFKRVAHHHPEPLNVEIVADTPAHTRERIALAVSAFVGTLLTGVEFEVTTASLNPRAKSGRRGVGSIGDKHGEYDRWGSFSWDEEAPTTPNELPKVATR